MTDTRRYKLPSKKVIIRFWIDKLEKIGVEISYVEECFACGKIWKLQRAHIKPIFNGGTNKLDNLHILCTGCHDESEFLWGGAYWNWLVETHKTQWKDGTAWILLIYKKCGINIDEFIKKTIKKNKNETKKTFEENKKRVFDKLDKIKEGGLSDNFWKKKMGIK